MLYIQTHFIHIIPCEQVQCRALQYINVIVNSSMHIVLCGQNTFPIISGGRKPTTTNKIKSLWSWKTTPCTSWTYFDTLCILLHVCAHLIFVKSKLFSPPFPDVRTGKVNPWRAPRPAPSLVHTSLVRLLYIEPLWVSLLVDTIVTVPLDVWVNDGHHLE